MHGRRYLRRVGGRIIFRRRVPPELKDRIGKSEIVRSLGPCTLADAAREARRLAVATDNLFMVVSSQTGLTREQIEELARDLFVEQVHGYERQRARSRLSDPDDLERAERIARRTAEGSRDMVVINDLAPAAALASQLLAERGIVEVRDEDFRLLCRQVLRAISAAAEIHLGHLEGNFAATPSDPSFVLATAPHRPADKPAEAAASGGPTFLEVSRRYAAERLRTGDWRPQSDHQAAGSFRLFAEILGDRPLGKYQRHDVGRFSDALQHLPAKYGQGAAFKGKTIKELVEIGRRAEGNIPRLAPRTLQKHLSFVSGMFGWAIDQGLTSGPNPAEGVFRFKRKKRPREERPAWEIDDLRRLFASPIWCGSASRERRSEPGNVVIHDAMFWTPLIAAFSGLRLEEIAALNVEDIVRQGSTMFFNISPAEDKLLKSAAAERKVPIHPKVLAVGLGKYAQEQKRRGATKLFPELARGGPDRRYGYYITKKIGRYFDKLGIERDFHGLRHTVITALMHAEIPEPIIRELVGHEAYGAETGRYTKGFPLSQLHEALSKLDYPGLDLSGVRSFG